MKKYHNLPSSRLEEFIIERLSAKFLGLRFEFDTRPVEPFTSEIVYRSSDMIVVSVGQMVEEYKLMNTEYGVTDIIDDVIGIIENGIINGWVEADESE